MSDTTTLPITSPCPVCGASTVQDCFERHGEYVYCVRCMSPKHGTWGPEFATREEAVADWNGKHKPLVEFEYINVYELNYSRRRTTRDYAVMNQRGEILGRINFYSAWRQHVLAPAPDTLWSKGCLADVIAFIEGIGKQWK